MPLSLYHEDSLRPSSRFVYKRCPRVSKDVKSIKAQLRPPHLLECPERVLYLVSMDRPTHVTSLAKEKENRVSR